jgi:hypothetical protein
VLDLASFILPSMAFPHQLSLNRPRLSRSVNLSSRPMVRATSSILVTLSCPPFYLQRRRHGKNKFQCPPSIVLIISKLLSSHEGHFRHLTDLVVRLTREGLLSMQRPVFSRPISLHLSNISNIKSLRKHSPFTPRTSFKQVTNTEASVLTVVFIRARVGVSVGLK